MQPDTLDKNAIGERLLTTQQWLAFHENKNVLSKADYAEIDRLWAECRRLKALLVCAS